VSLSWMGQYGCSAYQWNPSQLWSSGFLKIVPYNQTDRRSDIPCLHKFDSCRATRESGTNQEGGILPSTVKQIRDGAFKDCTQLNNIELPESLEQIGKKAFYGCTTLSSVLLPSTVKQFGDAAFRDCTQLKYVKIQEGVEQIPDVTFFGCTSLSRVLIPSTIKAIGNTAFERCAHLNNIELPVGLEQIGRDAFLGLEWHGTDDERVVLCLCPPHCLIGWKWVEEWDRRIDSGDKSVKLWRHRQFKTSCHYNVVYCMLRRSCATSRCPRSHCSF
jgi:hypothetical protein